MEPVCEACGAAFGDEAALRRHREEVHADPMDGAGIAGDTDETGGTTPGTEGGASRVQTE